MLQVRFISDDMKNRNVIWLFILPCLFIFPNMLNGQGVYKLKPFSQTSRITDEVVTGFSPDGIIISSNRSSSSFLSYTDKDKRNFFNMYEVKKNESGNWDSPELLSPDLKTLQNDGPASINGEGNLLVFTRNYDVKRFGNAIRANPNFGLFFADKINGVWTNIREFEYNVPDSKTTHPSLSADGLTLYFASDRPGGFGKYDLYYSQLINGRWSEPKNLGPKVNTADNDVYPFLHVSGRLYFSSAGHDRSVRHDLYYTEYYDNDWITPVKLPPPFNSSMNDFTIIIDENFENGFVTSTRRGSLDIFMFESTLPSFEICQQQKIDNYCFVFYEQSTMEIDTSLYKYRWDLGDGTRVEAVEAEHCFKGHGKYNVKLDVVDVLTKEIMFNQAEYEMELVKTIQAFISCPDTIRINSEAQFTGAESYFGDKMPVEYYWDFGDGEKAVGLTVKHAFLVPGKYNVKLGVTIQETKADEESLKKFCSYKSVILIE